MASPPRIPPPLLHIDQLTVARGSNRLLDGVSWRVEPRQHWAILGPNGCGKTSLLKTLTGYLTPSSGSLQLLGKTYGRTDWRDLRLQIGIVSSALQSGVPADEPALETVISGRYAQLDLWIKPRQRDTADARRWLTFVEGAALADRPWGYLSQGERQRVLIARALMAEPRLLILDEPCAGLDPIAREHFLGFIEALARKPKGPALILVTHHVEEITPAFSHALVLRAGRVVASGPRGRVVTSRVLSTAFGAPLRLSRRGPRLTLHVV